MTSRRPAGFRVFRGAEGVSGALGPNVVAFGKFDGVHLGHQALLDRAAGASRRLGLPYGVVTFERHPDAYLRRAPVPPMLTGLGDKLRLFRDSGALRGAAAGRRDRAQRAGQAVHPRRPAWQAGTPGRRRSNFRFGHRGAGGVLTIRELLAVEGLDGVEVGTVEVAGGPVSARIRATVAQGNVELARDLLGRPYEVTGRLCILSPSVASVVVSGSRAASSPGEYLGSFQTQTRPATAVVEVSGREGGRHRLTVCCEGAGLAGTQPAASRAHIAFEKRL